MRALLREVAVLALAACAARSGTTGEASSPSRADAAQASDDALVVEIDRGDGSAPARYTLNCADITGSDHPAAQAACDHLAAMEEPFAPVPADAVCAQIYGGPETAHVTGRWRGEPVDLRLARNDGCRMTQWDDLGPLLPAS